MEVYNDTNANGTPAGPSEILYNFAMNSFESEVFSVQKSVLEGVSYYT
jgi:hypothetical protein